MSNIKLLENLINYCSARNSVISQNIANIGTQNYKRQEVVFKDVLSNQISNLKTTESKHISLNGTSNDDEFITVVDDNNPDMVSGINNVDIEKEMAELAENTLQFKFAAKKISTYYKNLQKVIKGDTA